MEGLLLSLAAISIVRDRMCRAFLARICGLPKVHEGRSQTARAVRKTQNEHIHRDAPTSGIRYEIW